MISIVFFSDEGVVIDRQSLFEDEKTVNEGSFLQCLIQYDRIFKKTSREFIQKIQKKSLFFFSIYSMSLFAYRFFDNPSSFKRKETFRDDRYHIFYFISFQLISSHSTNARSLPTFVKIFLVCMLRTIERKQNGRDLFELVSERICTKRRPIDRFSP